MWGICPRCKTVDVYIQLCGPGVLFSSAFQAELGRYFVQSASLMGWPHLDKTQGSRYMKRIFWFSDGIRAMDTLGCCYVVVCMGFMVQLRWWKCTIYRNLMFVSASSVGVESRGWLCRSRSWYYPGTGEEFKVCRHHEANLCKLLVFLSVRMKPHSQWECYSTQLSPQDAMTKLCILIQFPFMLFDNRHTSSLPLERGCILLPFTWSWFE